MSESCPLLVLDTSVFIEAHRRYYSRDICPGFWDILEHYTRNGKVSSIDRVLDELTQPSNPDELEKWAKQAPKELFASAAELRVINVFSQMQLWAQKNTQFRPEAIDEFARGADGWLAAYAKANGAVLVTQEVLKEGAKKRIPLPNVCREFNIPYLNSFDMLRQLGARLDWRQI